MILAKRLMMCLLKVGWGEWILNPAVTVNINGIAHYTAYKTNQREYYDSYANLDLTEAIVRSLHDEGMQQWQAVKDACDELTGVTDWVFDSVNNRVSYTAPSTDPFHPTNEYYYTTNGSGYPAATLNESCRLATLGYGEAPNYYYYHGYNYDSSNNTHWCSVSGSGRYDRGFSIGKTLNPNYDPLATLPVSHKSFAEISQQIILNSSSSNQTISLMAEAYLENVAQSIFNSDESKQFVKLSDLIDQFEENKVLRI